MTLCEPQWKELNKTLSHMILNPKFPGNKVVCLSCLFPFSNALFTVFSEHLFPYGYSLKFYNYGNKGYLKHFRFYFNV